MCSEKSEKWYTTYMALASETFFTAVGCMDGRVQDVIAKFGQQKFGVKYPDTITEAGIVGLLAKDPVDEALLGSVKFKVADVSIGMHQAKGVVVHGHQECAGNPVNDEQQKDDIRKSVTLIQTLVGSVPVVGVFVKRSDANPEQWVVEEIPQTVTV